ncbi:histidine phosphatase family protein [Sphingomonas tabacisoli]|uniref:Histidine phosphatase family protein n=1 Tax=Sphingomonas tabacisoli TaxID=2249466 RepID=A0ABW4I311_9SPHN
MSRIVHLIRHGSHQEVGKVLSGRSEIALDETGRTDADNVVELLADLPIVSLHSSPRRRAWETSLPLARSRGLDVRRANALDEIDFGGFSGRAFATLDPDPDWRRWNGERATARCPGGETMGEAVARARAYLLSLPQAATPAVCVTHCDIIRGVVADQLGLGLDSLFRFDCDPGSLTTLTLDAGGTRLLTLNAQARR